MGFSSFLDAVDGSSIPNLYSRGNSVDEDLVVLVLPDDRTIKGYYNGYGDIDQYSIYTNVGDVIDSLDFSEVMRSVKIVKDRNYTGQLFNELSVSKFCPFQGFFYPDDIDFKTDYRNFKYEY